MPSTCDYHIHTHYLKCANATMQVPDILRRCEELGLQSIAITDHLNAPQFLEKHFLIKQDLAELETPLDVRFGVEVNVTDPATGAVSIDEAQLERAGFTVVIGGVHSSYHEQPDKRSIVELQQRLMLQVIANPLVDVLVHPWWFPTGEFQEGGALQWLRDMSEIPDDYAVELGQAAAANNTAVEANYSAIWSNPAYTDEFKSQYTDYITRISNAGAKISIGSDAHDISALPGVHPMADILAQQGITGDKLWHP